MSSPRLSSKRLRFRRLVLESQWHEYRQAAGKNETYEIRSIALLVTPTMAAHCELFGESSTTCGVACPTMHKEPCQTPSLLR